MQMYKYKPIWLHKNLSQKESTVNSKIALEQNKYPLQQLTCDTQPR